MPEDTEITSVKLDELLNEYEAALREWADVIRTELELASSNSTVAEVDRWERACDAEEEARKRALSLRSGYESLLRRKFYHF